MTRPVLVTGASGFIGRHLVARLLAEGHRVRALVRRPTAVGELASLGAEAITADLTSPASFDRFTDGVGTVFHLAGQLHVRGIPLRHYQRLHVDGTVRLIESCADQGIDRFLLCTTTGVLGPTTRRPADEDTIPHPSNAYEATKAEAEAAAVAVARRRRLPLVIARPGLVFGPRDLHLLGLFRAIRGGYYRTIGDGHNLIHPIFIRDLVDGLLCTLDCGADGRAYNLVGSGGVAMAEFSEAIGQAVGRPVSARRLPRALAMIAGAAFEMLPLPRRRLPLTRSRVRFMTQDRVYDGRRARDELGFQPRTELRPALALTVQWYREQRLL